MAAIVGGLACGIAMKILGAIFVMPGWFYPFGNQAPICLLVSIVLCVAGTLIHPAPAPGTEVEPVTFWNSRETLAAGMGDRWYSNVWLWAGLLLLLTCLCMLVFSQIFFPTH
jgi:hypothetical protein